MLNVFTYVSIVLFGGYALTAYPNDAINASPNDNFYIFPSAVSPGPQIEADSDLPEEFVRVGTTKGFQWCFKYKAQNGEAYFKNKWGAVFYGDPSLAQDASKKQVFSLDTLQVHLDLDWKSNGITCYTWHAASQVIEAVKLAIMHNSYICMALFTHFLDNNTSVLYGSGPTIYINGNWDRIPVHIRAHKLYETFVGAYKLSIKRNISSQFFSEIVPEKQEPFVNLHQLQDRLTFWCERHS
ncbi:hypothetical protein [Candidatus Odyssella thessalonicensis]|uniref:hypothetical protein n=1 Tax=Candidatus Odyssella thessalonicensis TaxID=84647 RepID=UPI000225B187|nr:hypothetical protein [Candidatus Odyssella thessalonicensis]